MTTVVVHWCYINKTESTEVVFLLILFKSNLYCSHSLNGDQFTECSLLFLTPLFSAVFCIDLVLFFSSVPTKKKKENGLDHMALLLLSNQ